MDNTGHTDSSRGKLIAEMDASERPREKALIHGFDALTDAELLAILFNTGVRNKSVVELSEEILQYLDGHLSKLVRMTPEALCARFKGIGPAKALTLIAAVQLGMRAAADAMKSERLTVKSSADIARIYRERLQWLDHEQFWAVYLSQSNTVISERLIGKGGLTQTVADVRLVVRNALQSNAAGIILIHNHPSGNLNPSKADRDLTQKIKAAAQLFDIRLLDHLIVADRGYYSFCDEGAL